MMQYQSIIPCKQKSLIEQIHDKFKLFVIQQIDSPALFLITTIFVTLFEIEVPSQLYYALFISSIVIALLFFRNHFYFFNLSIHGGIGWWAILNIGLCMIAANEKWKMYLLFFSFSSLLDNNQKLVYLTLLSGIVLYQTHQYLIFKTLKDNEIFYCGFGAIIAFALLEIFLAYLEEDHKYIHILIIPISFYTFYTIFHDKLMQLLETNIKDIKSPEVAFHYINLIKQKLSEEYYKYSIIAKHKQNCQNPQCSCHATDQIDTIQHLQSIYREFLQNNKIPGWNFLENKYINFQLDQGRLVNSLIRIVKQHQNGFNYFRTVQRLRNIQKLAKLIQKNDYLIAQNSLHRQIFEYDYHCRHQIQEMIEILTNKISFWKEVGKELPKMSVLEKQGLLLVSKVEQLHKFYQIYIKKKQEKLCCYIGTIYYSMFLISTTNFKEYSQTLLKATTRNLQEVKINYNDLSQIQGFSAKRTDVLLPIKSGDRTESNQIIIENVSQSFCRLLKRSKSQVIGQSISSFIPQNYWNVHQNGILQFFEGKIDKNSKFLGKRQDYPLKLKNNFIQQVNTFIKLYPHITNQLRFLCLIQAKIRQSMLIITNFKLQNLGSEPYSKPNILKNPTLKEVIAKLQQKWLKQKKIQEIEVLLIQNQERYFVEIKSPFALKFLESALPPLHLTYKDQSESQGENYMEEVAYCQIKNCIQKIQQNLSQKYTDSQSVTTQGKASIITILSAFTQSKKISFFQKGFLLIFIYFAVINIANSVMTNTFTGLEQINDPNKNLMQNFKTIVDIKQGFLKVFIFVYDVQLVQKNFFTSETIFRIYGQTKKQYLKTMNGSFKSRYNNLNALISYNLALFPEQTTSLIRKYLLTRVPFEYKGKPQQATIKNLMKNCQLDVLLISQGTPFKETMLQKTFSTYVEPALSSVINNFSDIYEERHSQIRFWNIFLFSIFTLLLILFLIPWIYFHQKLIQKNVAIFDLIVSIQVPLIRQEINTLKNIKCLFKKVKCSNQFSIIEAGSIKNLVEEKKTFSRMSEMCTNSNTQKKVDYQDACWQQIEIIELRRRSGQLNLQGSQAQRKTINLFKLILPLLFLLTASLFIAAVIIKLQKSDESRSYEQYFYKRHKAIARQHQFLANAKYMYDETNKTELQSAKFKNIPLDAWFSQALKFQQQIFQERQFNTTPVQCPQARKSNEICKYPNSQYSLAAIFLRIIKQAFLQFQFEYTQKKRQYRTNLFFAQTVLRQLAIMHSAIINQLIQLKQAAQIKLSSQLQSIFIMGFIWAAIVLIVGIYFIHYYRLKYIKQVTILLFLNMDMITSNKRVQSFLQKLSKQR